MLVAAIEEPMSFSDLFDPPAGIRLVHYTQLRSFGRPGKGSLRMTCGGWTRV